MAIYAFVHVEELFYLCTSLFSNFYFCRLSGPGAQPVLARRVIMEVNSRLNKYRYKPKSEVYHYLLYVLVMGLVIALITLMVYKC